MTCRSLFWFYCACACLNSWQARNTPRSDHWSAPLFMFLLPAENSCMHMRNKIKTNRDKSSNIACLRVLNLWIWVFHGLSIFIIILAVSPNFSLPSSLFTLFHANNFLCFSRSFVLIMNKSSINGQGIRWDYRYQSTNSLKEKNITCLGKALLTKSQYIVNWWLIPIKLIRK